MVLHVVPFSAFVVTKGVIHVCEFRAAKSSPSFWNNIPVLKSMELAVILAGAGFFFFFFLLTTGHVLELVGIGLLAVLGDILIRSFCFYITARKFCESSGRARRCPKQYRLLQCATTVNCGRCDAASQLLRRTGRFSTRRSRPVATRKPRFAKVETHNVW